MGRKLIELVICLYERTLKITSPNIGIKNRELKQCTFLTEESKQVFPDYKKIKSLMYDNKASIY